ncbi:hypothetical protein SAMN05216598_5042 [Pseudomonas asplenii]|uniref:Uncharacterized protein n=1 Tax=Pseudomonas asplenii TaxID=53407 RepID=A0A1H1ZFG8_9PSED|nr:hypothetical protein [Pseudomonas asplenii]SDT32400.1 hypothetical protein SAMN05216598_5042 [Pseudomonas asplenii]
MTRTLPKTELKALLVEADANGLAPDDLGATCEQFGITPKDVLNELAIAVAEGYLDETFTYGFCDSVMNGIINAVMDLGMTDDMPQPAFSLYQAFDQGEWIRRGDSPDSDPSEKYTRPAVQEILRTIRG